MDRVLAPVPLCRRCEHPEGGRCLVPLAVRGSAAEVCHHCFLLEELGQLTSTLPPGDVIRDLVEEGLQAPHDLVRLRRAQLLRASAEDGAAVESRPRRQGRT